MTRLVHGLAIVLLGLLAGFFYAYSNSVMWGLDDAPPAVAIEAMKGINRVVRNPIFAASFFGAPVATALACVRLWRRDGAPVGLAAGLGLALSLAGVALTVAINVPMNQALAPVDVASVDAASVWEDYSGRWTVWNHVRFVATLAAFAVMTGLALRPGR